MEKRWITWKKTPIPGLSLSASGVLALADLSTIAQRTALTGTSSWLDTLVLAPGIHYQQSAEILGEVRPGSQAEITDLGSGNRRVVTNTATLHYFNRIGSKNNSVTLDVGLEGFRGKSRKGRKGASFGPRSEIFKASDPSSKLSAALYLLSPILTVGAICIMIALEDWWGLSEICALMTARLLNVWVIKSRTTAPPPESKQPNVHENWWVNLDEDRTICIRGLAHDLEAITTGTWMREKSVVEGYVEAIAKLTVYMVAVLSGNMSQAGDITLISLLLTSAGVLALSNARANTYNMNGRVASVTGSTQTEDPKDPKDSKGSKGKHSSTGSTRGSDGTLTSSSDFEKSEASIVFSRTYPFNDEVHYV